MTSIQLDDDVFYVTVRKKHWGTIKTKMLVWWEHLKAKWIVLMMMIMPILVLMCDDDGGASEAVLI